MNAKTIKLKNHQEWAKRFDEAVSYMKIHFSLDEIELLVEDRKLQDAYKNLFRCAEKADDTEALKMAVENVKSITG